ncbi:MAG: hypothetical protein ACR2ND_07710, partial [Solirubrobacteraceae bacterium]
MNPHDHRMGGLSAALAALGGAYLLPGLAPSVPALRRALGVADTTVSGSGCLLTFDDGPHPQGTPAMLAALGGGGGGGGGRFGGGAGGGGTWPWGRG